MTTPIAKSTRRIVAVVPAAGIGSRMQMDKPKQYLHIHGKTILEHTLSVLLGYPLIEKIILAVAANNPYISTCPLLTHPKIQLVEGGSGWC